MALPVVVVSGAPGLGKTALAVHAAHALRPAFPDGQLYVTLRGAGEHPMLPDEALARFLRDLGVPPARVPEDAEERAAMYRTLLAGRRMLILLDDARAAAQVRPLLPGGAPCAVLVTSRHRLTDLAGAQLLDLGVLSEAEAVALFTRIVGDRRAAAEPGPVRDVLTACAGLPLAVRIAAARLAARPSWDVRILAGRLADTRRRMDELATGDLAVRACFEVSFGALRSRSRLVGADPARAFRLLGLWPGPSLSLPAAAALLGQRPRAAADAMEELVDAHLLEAPVPDRYAFHDLLRAYAAEQAAASESAEAAAGATVRVLGWYLRATAAAATAVSPHGDRPPLDPPEPGEPALRFEVADEALRWCAAERANLVAATRHAAELSLHEIAWKLPATIMVCLYLNGFWDEWTIMHQIALASARELGDRRGEAWMLNNLGMVLAQRRAAGALEYFEQAVAICQQVGDRRGQARAANNLAFGYGFPGRHQEAAAALRDVLALQREVGNRYGEGIALCNLGEAYLELGQLQDALARSQEALAVVRELGSDRIEGYALYNIGRAELALGRAGPAADLLEQAAAIHRAVGDRFAEAHDLRCIGHAQVRAGDPAVARTAWERAGGIFASLGEDAEAAGLRAGLRQLAAGRGPDSS